MTLLLALCLLAVEPIDSDTARARTEAANARLTAARDLARIAWATEASRIAAGGGYWSLPRPTRRLLDAAGIRYARTRAAAETLLDRQPDAVLIAGCYHRDGSVRESCRYLLARRWACGHCANARIGPYTISHDCDGKCPNETLPSGVAITSCRFCGDVGSWVAVFDE